MSIQPSFVIPHPIPLVQEFKQEGEIKLVKFKGLEILHCPGSVGEGSYKICRPTLIHDDKNDKTLMAVRLSLRKCFRKDDEVVNQFIHGMDVSERLAELGVPGICRPIDYVWISKGEGQPKKVMAYFKYSRGANLYSLLNKRDLKPEEQNKIAHTLLTMLKEMHQRKVYHRDIKTNNILIFKEGPELADFDMVWAPGDGERGMKKCFGTIPCYPPEIAIAIDAKRELTETDFARYDVWAMGLVLYSIYYGHNRFPSELSLLTCYKPLEENMDAFKKVAALEELYPDPAVNEKDSLHMNPMGHLIWGMLRIDPAKRLTAEQALQEFKKLPS